MPAPENDAGLLEAAVREAGALALTFFRQGLRGWNKRDGSPVSEADIAVDGLLKNRILGLRPGDGWLSEETPDDLARLDRERLWIADPIDGTRSFIKGGDAWCIGVALAVRGRPMLGAVYCPTTDDFYWAEADQGARLNGRALVVGAAEGLEGARILASRAALKRFNGQAVAAEMAMDVPLLLRLCRVAAGDADAAFSPGHKHDWDLAAGDLIVHEAGGCVTGLDGKRYKYNRAQAYQLGLIAANAALHREMMTARAA